MAKSLTYRRLRAPANDGELLLVPGWRESLQIPRNNATLLSGADFGVLGVSFHKLRREVRSDVLQLAHAHTSAYAKTDMDGFATDPVALPIIMSGHQPQLFHPGVWAKNFLIDRLAAECGGIAVQVVIDYDNMRDHAISVPTGTLEKPHVVSVPFEAFAEPLPYERRFVHDINDLRTFADRVSDPIRPFVANPMVNRMWPDVLDAVQRNKPLGHAFAEARHKVEFDAGLRTWEVPLGQLADKPGFLRFALHLFAHHESLRTHYNARLAEYRTVHRLRSPAQPLPDLRNDKDWLEMPFWFWTKNDPTRRALWLRPEGDHLVFGDQRQNWTLPHPLHTPDAAMEKMQSVVSSDVSVRPRALTNTLFLRLFACDCFVHGIGGAKYDQVTDLLMFDLFGIAAPGLIAASQTTRLPVQTELVPESQIVREKQLLRQMYFHPERFLSDSDRGKPQVSSAVKNKTKWTRRGLPRGERLERHRQIESANATLRNFLQENTEARRKFLSNLESRLPASRIFGSREWSFCLFPYEFLTKRLLESGLTDI